MVSRDAIAALRRAIEPLDWDRWRAALGQALTEITPDQMLALTEAVLRRGLPTFEQNHPGETWPRRALDGQADGLPPECAGPGGNNFAHACEMLVDARARRHDPAGCRELGVGAISAAVIGEMLAIWGADHPDAFRVWYTAALEGNLLGADDPTIGWHRGPEIQEVQRALWNDVADRLAALASPRE